MSVEEILAACRRMDGGESAGDSTESSTPAPASEPTESVEETPVAAEEAPAPAPAEAKKSASAMSVEEMLAAARAEKSKGGAKEAPEGKPAAKAAPSSAGAPKKKAGEMSVEEMLAAARAEKSGAKEAPAAKAKPKPAAKAPAKGKSAAAPVAKEKPAVSGPLDTQSILSAARKSDKRGPMSKSEAAKLTGAEADQGKKAKPKLEAPPMPEKPAYAARPAQPARPAQQPEVIDRRSFFSTGWGMFFGSSLAAGFTLLAVTHLLWLLSLARFMFPNILTEPPTKFKVGFPDELAPGQVQTKFKAQFGVWIVQADWEGEMLIFALKSVCTHLGCTPNWLEAEQKFKCPCHGSGFYIDGVNFEGPAPRPLERYAIRVADDGQLEVDKSRTFQQEMGQWEDPASFVLG